MTQIETHDYVRTWLEDRLLHEIRTHSAEWDYWGAHRGLTLKPPKKAVDGAAVEELVAFFCATPCQIEKAPVRFSRLKSKFRKVMVLAAMVRLERDFRIRRVEGLLVQKKKCRPRMLVETPRYKILNLMEAIALAAAEGGGTLG